MAAWDVAWAHRYGLKATVSDDCGAICASFLGGGRRRCMLRIRSWPEKAIFRLGWRIMRANFIEFPKIMLRNLFVTLFFALRTSRWQSSAGGCTYQINSLQ